MKNPIHFLIKPVIGSLVLIIERCAFAAQAAEHAPAASSSEPSSLIVLASAFILAVGFIIGAIILKKRSK